MSLGKVVVSMCYLLELPYTTEAVAIIGIVWEPIVSVPGLQAASPIDIIRASSDDPGC